MESSTQKSNQAPWHVGIIMDGNRRYAKEKGLPTLEGHRAGYAKLREVRKWAMEAGVKEMTVYAFSTENWNRTAEEVGYLMNLFRKVIDEAREDAKTDDARLLFFGERTKLAKDIVDAIVRAEDETKDCTSFTFGIALSYGGRAEIIDAIHRIPKEQLSTISEKEFAQLLWTNEMRDPDLVIRTSGEERLSNFLPWQSVYSELCFTKTLWPAFSKEEFLSIIKNYSERERRLGK